jgi:hypothetical protein
MIITESLSKGLRNRFFIEMHDEISRNLAILINDDFKYKKNTIGWKKYSNYLKKVLNRSALVFYDGGSNSKPYIGCVCLGVDPTREFNKWNEKCLTGTIVIANFEPMSFEYRQALFNIGEHAVARLYERGKPVIKNNFDVDIHSILPELSSVGLWGAYWSGIFINFKKYLGKELALKNLFRPPIPSVNGIFLGELSFESYSGVEIRTFINDAQLTFEQSELKKILLEAGSGLESSPLAFYPLVDYLKIDKTFPETAMISHSLLKNYDPLAHAIFAGIDDDKLRVIMQNKFRSFLKEMADFTSEILIYDYKKNGVKKFHIEINKAYLKAISKI